MPILCAFFSIGLACTFSSSATAQRSPAPFGSHVTGGSSKATKHATTVPVSRSQLDGESTMTSDWACIARHESGASGGPLAPNGGKWQFQGQATLNYIGLFDPIAQYSVAVQNAAALRLYKYGLKTWGNGYEAWRADWYVCRLPH